MRTISLGTTNSNGEWAILAVEHTPDDITELKTDKTLKMLLRLLDGDLEENLGFAQPGTIPYDEEDEGHYEEDDDGA